MRYDKQYSFAKGFISAAIAGTSLGYTSVPVHALENSQALTRLPAGLETSSTASEAIAVSSVTEGLSPSTQLATDYNYGVSVPIDLYADDATTTTQIQTVEPESSFVVTYVQNDTALVEKMEEVLSALGTDVIEEESYQDTKLYVYYLLPSDLDTSGISSSSFILEGFYSLFEIADIGEETYDSVHVIALTFSPITDCTSVSELLSAWQENASGKITLTGLSVPSGYSVGDLFYIGAVPQGIVSVSIDGSTYDFEALASPEAGNDDLAEPYPDTGAAGYQAHVTFQVAAAETETEEPEDSETEETAEPTEPAETEDPASEEDTADTSDTETEETAEPTPVPAQSAVNELKVVVNTKDDGPGLQSLFCQLTAGIRSLGAWLLSSLKL